MSARFGLGLRLFALLLAGPALAQEPAGPQVSVTLDPEGPVTVGTPVTVTVTLLVPTYMPEPPVWPDLEIADAVTRLPERATNPVTRRVGAASWSGLSRSYRIVPQRAADYELGPAEVGVTWADPGSSAPVESTAPVPDIAFTATVPPGAEDMDPFLPAGSLTLAAGVEGLPDAPKPGDAFTLTLVTTADGPPAMLLPPLVDRLATPAGLRAYPRQPVLADGPPATRTEAVAYVIERPGSYVLPALSLDWWNTGTAARETATTDAVSLEVPAPPGWRDPAAPRRPRVPWWAAALGLAAVAGLLVLGTRRRGPRAPSERGLYRRLRRSVRADPPGLIREHLAAWEAARAAPLDRAGIEAALRPLERLRYGEADAAAPEAGPRRRLLDAIDAAREAAGPAGNPVPALPGLNPATFR
jgi:hypothetical protein